MQKEEKRRPSRCGVCPSAGSPQQARGVACFSMLHAAVIGGKLDRETLVVYRCRLLLENYHFGVRSNLHVPTFLSAMFLLHISNTPSFSASDCSSKIRSDQICNIPPFSRSKPHKQTQSASRTTDSNTRIRSSTAIRSPTTTHPVRRSPSPSPSHRPTRIRPPPISDHNSRPSNSSLSSLPFPSTQHFPAPPYPSTSSDPPIPFSRPRLPVPTSCPRVHSHSRVPSATPTRRLPCPCLSAMSS
ncbi:hypothetical protein IWZ01DRAFT_184371 [Phyllosticta capitalensis]